MNYFILLIVLLYLTLDFSIGAITSSFSLRRFTEDFVRTWPNRIVQISTWTVSLIYLFAAFGKLNSDFFFSSSSCAISVANEIFQMFSPISDSTFLTLAGPVIAGLAVFAEFTIGALLLFKPTRKIAIYLGIPFHIFLGAAGHFRLSATLFAFYLMCAPAETDLALKNNPRWKLLLRLSIAASAVILLMGLTANSMKDSDYLDISAGWYNLALYISFCLLSLIILFPLISNKHIPVATRFAPRTKIQQSLQITSLVFCLAAVFLNGVLPYFGGKTISTFSMFSNLRTESGLGNHFLIPPKAGQLLPYQSDLVFVSYIKPSLEHRNSNAFNRTRLFQLTSHQNYHVPKLELIGRMRRLQSLGVSSGIEIQYRNSLGEVVTTDWLNDPFFNFPDYSAFEVNTMSFRLLHSDNRCTQ
jgi:hypothetical protein